MPKLHGLPLLVVLALASACAEPRRRTAAHPSSDAWPALPARCHNPEDYVRCARIRRDQALAHRVPLETAARDALQRCAVSCLYPHGPIAFPDAGMVRCCDPEGYARCVQADREALIAQGVPPIAAQQRSPWRCGYGPHCGPVPRNPNDRDASCADVPEFLRPRRSLREYYRAMDSDAAVEW